MLKTITCVLIKGIDHKKRGNFYCQTAKLAGNSPGMSNACSFLSFYYSYYLTF
jgi:hypothetical protein